MYVVLVFYNWNKYKFTKLLLFTLFRYFCRAFFSVETLHGINLDELFILLCEVDDDDGDDDDDEVNRRFNDVAYPFYLLQIYALLQASSGK